MNEFDIKALIWDDNPLFIERSQLLGRKHYGNSTCNANGKRKRA